MDRVSFSVASGQICSLMGANGVGKTTVIRRLLAPHTPLQIMQLLLDFSPLHHYIVLSCGILLKGAGLDELWLFLLGGAAFFLGLWRLGRRFRK